MVPSALNFDPRALQPAPCRYRLGGCRRSSALDYHPAAAVDDGSCAGGTAGLSSDLVSIVKFGGFKIAESTGVDLTKADVIVSGGRGVGDPEKFPEIIQPLADALGGAWNKRRKRRLLRYPPLDAAS